MITQFLTPGKRGVPIMFEKMVGVSRQFQELLFLRLGGEGTTSRSNREFCAQPGSTRVGGPLARLRLGGAEVTWCGSRGR